MGRGNKKVSDDVLLEAYSRIGNVWKVAAEIGLCGQSVHERLVTLGKINKINAFSEADKDILLKEYKAFKSSGKLNELAARMGRTKQFICRQAKALGLTNQHPVEKEWLRKDGSNPYARDHARVRARRGRPCKCEVCGTDNPRKHYDWANLTGEYDNPADYKRMCKSCHKQYDKNRPMLAHK